MAKKEAPATEKKSAVQEEKARALEAARLQIEKQFGKGSLMKMGENSGRVEIDAIPSGSILLDAALGIGGYPRGRVVEIYGPESSGKTTLALHAIAESQKQGGIAAFVDAEHALDPVYAKNLGVNVDELWVSQPDTGEQALEIVESLVRSGAMDIIVVDSVAATLLALFALPAASVHAQDWESFAASSRHPMDPVILRIMAESDLEQNIGICKGLGRRPDADVSVFMDSLAAAHVAKTAPETEVLLRWLLASALAANPQEGSLRAWHDANAASVDMLLEKITQWRDAQLKGTLLGFALIANSSVGMRAIMEVGTGVVRELERSDGLIPSEDAALALDFLAASRKAGRSDFFPSCVEIARLSRDAVLVKAARSAAAALASAP